MGEDLKLFRFLSYKSKHNTPVHAILLQSSISLFLILTSSFDSVILYTGFTLNLSTFLTVLGVFVHRARYPEMNRPYKTWGYPVVPVLYLLVMLYTLIFLVVRNPFESSMGFITVFSGTIFYIINWQSGKDSRSIKLINSNDLKQ